MFCMLFRWHLPIQTALVLVPSAFGAMGCECSAVASEANLVVSVTLDGNPLPNAAIDLGGRANAFATTDAAGIAAFNVPPGDYTVTLGSAVLDGATCAPGLSQPVTVALGPNPATASFDCMTRDAGTGGTGGSGTGGTGGGGTGGTSGTGGGGAGGGGMGGNGGTGGTGGTPGMCDEGVAQGAAGLTDQVTLSAGSATQGGQVTVNVPVNASTGQVFVDLTNGLFLTGQGSAATDGSEVVSVLITVPNGAQTGTSRVDVDLFVEQNDPDNRTSYTLSDTSTLWVREVFVDGTGGGEEPTSCVVPEITILQSAQ